MADPAEGMEMAATAEGTTEDSAGHEQKRSSETLRQGNFKNEKRTGVRPMTTQMTRLTLQALIAAVVFSAPAISYAHNGEQEHVGGHENHHGGSGQNNNTPASPGQRAVPTNVKIKLRPAVKGGGEGEGSLQRKVKGGTERDLRFSVEATISPATIATQTSELHLAITRANAPFANCTLVLHDADDDDSADSEAEYKLDLRSRNAGPVVAKSGFCDTDPATPAVDAGIPALAAGDVLTITDGNGVVLLSGVASKKK